MRLILCRFPSMPKKISNIEMSKLFEGVSLSKNRLEPDLTLFDAENVKTLLKNAKRLGVQVIGIDCYMSNRMEYFTTVSSKVYTASKNVKEKDWAEKAVDEILKDYSEQVLRFFPGDKPVFAVDFLS